MADEAKKITLKNWTSRFSIVGHPKLNDNTFKINEHSNRSSWIYSTMNLGIDCGEKYGTCYANMMGGYSPERETMIYAFNKEGNGNVHVSWDDRFNDSVLEQVNNNAFIRVGLEKDVAGKTVTQQFLSPYDAIEYISNHLTEDMVVRVNGNLRYSIYNNNVNVNKEITSIYLSNVEPKDFAATFTQSVLINKDSCSLTDIDKETGIMPVDVIVLSYLKEFNGHEIKGQWPYHMTMEYQFNLAKKDMIKKIYDKLFKVKKGYTQITFNGEFVSSGGVVTPSIDDIPDDIRELIGIVYTEEEALEQCATSTGREKHMLLKSPAIFNVRDQKNSDVQRSVLQMFPEQYTEEELDMSWAYGNQGDEQPPFGDYENEEDGSIGDDVLSWLDA